MNQVSSQVSMPEDRKNPYIDSDSESFSYSFGNIDNYELCSRIGRGKYSTVFSGRSTNGSMCVLKVLKPVRLSKINREIRILESLRGGPSICELLDVVRDVESSTISLVLTWTNNDDFKTLNQIFTIKDIAFYMLKVLQALEYAHNKGIMHRDIKPQNIMIDHSQKIVSLIDWGLADFYVPGNTYQVRVATRHYKSPELLLGLSQYNPSVDIWGLGCTFATFLFKKIPFFRARENNEILSKIAEFVGTDELEAFVEKNGLQSCYNSIPKIKPFKKKTFDQILKENPDSMITPEAFDLLTKMLAVDHRERISASDAIKHPFFNILLDSTG